MKAFTEAYQPFLQSSSNISELDDIRRTPPSIPDSLIGRQRRRQGRRHERWIRFCDVTLSTLRGGPLSGCMGLMLVLGLSRYVHFTPKEAFKSTHIYMQDALSPPCRALILPVTAAIRLGLGDERNVNPHALLQSLIAIPSGVGT